MTSSRQKRILRNYKTRNGRIVPVARVTPKRCYRLIWLRCAECGSGFWAVRSDALTCGGKCRARRHRKWQAEKRRIAKMLQSEQVFSQPLYPVDEMPPWAVGHDNCF